MYKDLQLAIEIAVEAHKTQEDVSGKPYILHPLYIMTQMEKAGFDNEALCVAVMHDVVEDTYVTLDMLRDWFNSPAIIAGVDAVTRRDNETYKEYKQRCFQNLIGLAVKYYDSHHNLTRTEGVTDIKFLNFIEKRYGETVNDIVAMLANDPGMFDSIKRPKTLETLE